MGIMDEFRDAIAKITIEGTPIRGTGFLVGPGLVATALHVVADRKVVPPEFFNKPIQLKFRGHETKAEVIPNKWNQEADCVLLRCLDAEPLAQYPTIPLRELTHSDDLFKTHGYPDAQPFDGATWAGKVRDFRAQLTNFYQTGERAYQPVLQLYCEEAGAGTGAPPSGLSGAPVVVGSAAVGLMRFALMRGGGTVAGTLYACSATDIAALDPQLKLRPPLIPVVVLTPEQAEQLKRLLVEAFMDNLSGLRRAVRFSLGIEAERGMPSVKDVTEFASLLVPTLVQEGPGMISVLLRGVITSRPTDENLRAFATQVSEYALRPLNDEPGVQRGHDDNLVREINLALAALTAMPRREEVRGIVASYRQDFEKTREQILLLAKYKELHNCLHEVEARLDSIVDSVKRLIAGENVFRYLKEAATSLDELVANARPQSCGLPTEDEEQTWISELASCAADLRSASRPGAPVGAVEKVPDIPDRLRSILSRASDINNELVRAAKQVRLDNFAETMRSVEQQLGPTMSESSLQRLREGTLAVGRLRSRLAGLVSEHDEWQSINSDLQYARTQTSKHQPQNKFAAWNTFKGKLAGLCDAFPQERWSIELRTTMEPWPDAPPAEPRIPVAIAQLEDDFLEFHHQCVRRFIRVDDELNELCARVALFQTPLDGLLEI
jgi:Trypsin-like peptidase domain